MNKELINKVLGPYLFDKPKRMKEQPGLLSSEYLTLRVKEIGGEATLTLINMCSLRKFTDHYFPLYAMATGLIPEEDINKVLTKLKLMRAANEYTISR